MANFKSNEAILAKTISQPTFWPAICRKQKGDMYVVQIIYGETLQEAAEVPAENLRKLIPKASAPKKRRALWCRSHKCATSMAEFPSKCHKKSQVEAQEEDEAEEEDEAAPGPSKRHKKAQSKKRKRKPGPSKRHKVPNENVVEAEVQIASCKTDVILD